MEHTKRSDKSRPEARSETTRAPQPELTLLATAYTLDQLDRLEVDWTLPQVALAGRSNVGKSSCLNCLAGRKQLARTSATPGKTQSVNFFRVRLPGREEFFHLVDLPGYGYARRSKTERDQWAELMERYLAGPHRPRAVVMLVDGRHEPQKLDLALADFCRGVDLPVLLVCTKADKIKNKERQQRVAEWKEAAPDLAVGGLPLFFSSMDRTGREALWRRIQQAAGLADSAGSEGAEAMAGHVPSPTSPAPQAGDLPEKTS